MNDLIQLPTIEQINLEHRLANSKAAEAVQHATNCGLMLLQVKASLKHGEWLPWINSEIESGRLLVGDRQARRYMQLASNRTRESNLPEAPSIRAALELLTDKPEAPEQGALLDIEAEREAREKAEQEAKAEREARMVLETRQQETQAESNDRRKKIRDLEYQIDLLKAEQPEAKVVEKIIEKEIIPPDYQQTKETLATLQAEYTKQEETLKRLRKHQKKDVDEQVNRKLREHDREYNDKERAIQDAERYLESLQQKIDRYSSQQKDLETILSALERMRIELATFAAMLETCGPMVAPDAEAKPTRAIIGHMEVILTGLYARLGEHSQLLPALAVD